MSLEKLFFGTLRCWRKNYSSAVRRIAFFRFLPAVASYRLAMAGQAENRKIKDPENPAGLAEGLAKAGKSCLITGGNHATAQTGTVRYTDIIDYYGLMAGRKRDVGGNR
jgi:hypothetical protein